MSTATTQLKKFRTSECEHCSGTGYQLDHVSVGRHLRELRERAGISLRDIAIRLDWSAPYVSDLELGRRNWTPERIGRYKEALKST